MGEGIGPAVQSAILAADSIISNAAYDLGKLAKYSVPGFFRNRGKKRGQFTYSNNISK
jgi:flavin-dependent dehydrogenase